MESLPKPQYQEMFGMFGGEKKGNTQRDPHKYGMTGRLGYI